VEILGFLSSIAESRLGKGAALFTAFGTAAIPGAALAQDINNFTEPPRIYSPRCEYTDYIINMVVDYSERRKENLRANGANVPDGKNFVLSAKNGDVGGLVHFGYVPEGNGGFAVIIPNSSCIPRNFGEYVYLKGKTYYGYHRYSLLVLDGDLEGNEKMGPPDGIIDRALMRVEYFENGEFMTSRGNLGLLRYIMDIDVPNLKNLDVKECVKEEHERAIKTTYFD
jgi:hypothetical protein